MEDTKNVKEQTKETSTASFVEAKAKEFETQLTTAVTRAENLAAELEQTKKLIEQLKGALQALAMVRTQVIQEQAKGKVAKLPTVQ